MRNAPGCEPPGFVSLLVMARREAVEAIARHALVRTGLKGGEHHHAIGSTMTNTSGQQDSPRARQRPRSMDAGSRPAGDGWKAMGVSGKTMLHKRSSAMISSSRRLGDREPKLPPRLPWATGRYWWSANMMMCRQAPPRAGTSKNRGHSRIPAAAVPVRPGRQIASPRWKGLHEEAPSTCRSSKEGSIALRTAESGGS